MLKWAYYCRAAQPSFQGTTESNHLILKVCLSKPWRPKVFFIGNHHKCLQLALRLHLKYLCYGSTAIRNIFTFTVLGWSDYDV